MQWQLLRQWLLHSWFFYDITIIESKWNGRMVERRANLKKKSLWFTRHYADKRLKKCNIMWLYFNWFYCYIGSDTYMWIKYIWWPNFRWGTVMLPGLKTALIGEDHWPQWHSFEDEEKVQQPAATQQLQLRQRRPGPRVQWSGSHFILAILYLHISLIFLQPEKEKVVECCLYKQADRQKLMRWIQLCYDVVSTRRMESWQNSLDIYLDVKLWRAASCTMWQTSRYWTNVEWWCLYIFWYISESRSLKGLNQD